MKSIQKIELTFVGTSIKSAFSTAMELAFEYDVQVTFNFNGIMCYVSKNGKVETGVENYHKAIKFGVYVAYN